MQSSPSAAQPLNMGKFPPVPYINATELVYWQNETATIKKCKILGSKNH